MPGAIESEALATYDRFVALRDEIDRRWGPYMRKYGYCQATTTAGG